MSNKLNLFYQRNKTLELVVTTQRAKFLLWDNVTRVETCDAKGGQLKRVIAQVEVDLVSV